jgi:imidazolonepropionase-like amidohydrolase
VHPTVASRDGQPDAAILALVNGAVWQGTGASAAPATVVLVEGERIKAVGSADQLPIPSGATIIDCTGATLIPGLIDCHVHLTTNSTETAIPSAVYRSTTSPAHKLLDGQRNAGRALAAGFTTLRVVGHRGAGEVELRDFIERGHMVGPRLVVAPWWVSMTGGHGDAFYPTQWPRREWDTADGPDECRKLVRLQLRAGADFIKVMASGGLLSHGDKAEWPNYTVEELRAIVDEAHALDMRVAAHAHSVEGIKRSVAAGVDSIEHGTLANDECLDLLAETGTFLVPTLSITDWTAREGGARGVPADGVERMQRIRDQHFGMFRKAIERGVRVAMGTDSSGTICPFGENARELELYSELGMSPAAALRTATQNAAELLGRTDLGNIAPGALADILICSGNPLTDVSVLRQDSGIRGVLVSGRVVRLNESAVTPPESRMAS